MNSYIESYVEQNTQKMEYDREKLKYQSWLTAGLVLSGFGGKFPSYAEISGGDKSNSQEIDINDEDRLFASLKRRALLAEANNKGGE